VCDFPNLILGECGVVLDNKEFRSCNSSAGNVLSNKEEFPVIWYNVIVDDGSWFRILAI
jgi:hypothetical protein